jgi:hypothetical protein
MRVLPWCSVNAASLSYLSPQGFYQPTFPFDKAQLKMRLFVI